MDGRLIAGLILSLPGGRNEFRVWTGDVIAGSTLIDARADDESGRRRRHRRKRRRRRRRKNDGIPDRCHRFGTDSGSR